MAGVHQTADQVPAFYSKLAMSSPARVPRACQEANWMESVMNRTEPSPSTTFTPPVWYARREVNLHRGLDMQSRPALFGGTVCV